MYRELEYAAREAAFKEQLRLQRQHAEGAIARETGQPRGGTWLDVVNPGEQHTAEHTDTGTPNS